MNASYHSTDMPQSRQRKKTRWRRPTLEIACDRGGFPPVLLPSHPLEQEPVHDTQRSRRQLKVSWKAIVGVAVSAFLIWWVLRGEDPAEIIAHVSSANPWYFAAAILVGMAGFLVRAFRWKVLLHPLKADTRLHSRFASVSIGFAVNNVLPARLGEFARAIALSAVEPVPVSGAFGSLVVERFLDSGVTP